MDKLFVYLEINSMLVALLANIFSHSVGFLFILMMIVFFAVQRLLSWIRAHSFILFFFFYEPIRFYYISILQTIVLFPRFFLIINKVTFNFWGDSLYKFRIIESKVLNLLKAVGTYLKLFFRKVVTLYISISSYEVPLILGVSRIL